VSGRAGASAAASEIQKVEPARVAEKAHAPAHGLHQAAGDGQADAGARHAGAGLVQAVEGLEHMGLLGQADAQAGVGHRQRPVPGLGRHLDAHPPALAVVLDGVAQQVDQHLAQAQRVGMNVVVGQGRRRLDHDVAPRRIGLHHGHRLAQQRGQRHGAAVQRQLPGLDAGEVQQLVDHAQQVPARLQQQLQPLVLARQRRTAQFGLQQLGKAQHRVERVRSSWLMCESSALLAWLRASARAVCSRSCWASSWSVTSIRE
jgi:hypothetical protein